jgi:uncharacterized protein (DUF924 family)
MEDEIRAVLDEWFGTLDAQGASPPDKVERWFMKDPNFDAHLRERFGALVETALAGGLADWERQPPSAVAKLLLLDQFTRNIFRDTRRMFAGDPEAQRITLSLLEGERIEELPVPQRHFACMPLMHAESLELQQRGVREFERLVEAAPETGKRGAREVVRYAERHRDIVQRFGRFPHRNAMLGRETTPEEAEFLKTPGSSF